MKATFPVIFSTLLASAGALYFPACQMAVQANERPSPSSTVQSRYTPPAGYERIPLDKLSFGHYLRTLPLKPEGSQVHYYDGDTKYHRGVYDAVVDMELDPRDLQQCADAVMRLRGEYLYSQNRYDQIHFNFLSDGKPRHFLTHSGGDTSYPAFRKYMRHIFAYANTSSLHDELQPVANSQDVMPGDVFIQKGKPYGHAVIVLDVVQNEAGHKKMLLAQSYMPAQDTQVLINPSANNPTCWYPVQEGKLITPEWRFHSSDLRRFR
ncbi:DUF4846 domain-containing protein [Roseivirga sp. BDSF3-8]|uniref:DUF4846 domain-containing protein n=1 Tax=Roseivirga sp. BDSF3-8 TaxID=3241598 RepID=UPI003531F7CD